MEKKISTPLTEEITKTLRAGDSILLSGIVYTARDAAHGRLINLLDEGILCRTYSRKARRGYRFGWTNN